MRRPSTKSTIAPLAALVGLLATAAFAVDPINETLFGGLAVDGYDTVAYFTAGLAVEGKREFVYEWSGATWRFASAEHRDLFAADPAKYAPRYGGYCAYAVARGYTAEIDPEAWKIVDGRLYLNYDRDVQRLWEADVAGHVRAADANWPRLLAGETVERKER
jgi:hypothetical protein